MSRVPLDLSKFKKVKTDKHTSVFRHYEGHELTIAHSKLSKKLRDQLEQLPTQKPKAEKVQKFEQGGDVKSNDDFGYIAKAFTGDPAEQQAAHDAAMASLPKTPDDAVTTTQAAPMRMPQPAEPGMDREPTSSPAVMAAAAPMAPAAQADPYGVMKYANQQVGGLEQQKRGMQGVEIAKGALGAAEAKQEQAYQSTAQAAAQTYQDTMKHLMDQDQKYQNDVAAGHIDPRRFLSGLSTGGKIFTGIGLVLGGMGAGLTHGPNLAFQLLQDQVNKDIDAQKAELGKNENLLAHNIQVMGNVRAGTDLTRLQMNDILNSHLREEAGKSANPIALAQAQAIGGMFDAKKAEMMHGIAIQRAMMGGQGQGDQESQFQNRMQFLRMNKQDALAKDMESKHVPGVGQASKEIPSDVMKELVARQDLQEQVGRLRQWAQQNSGSIDPKTVSYGRALAKQTQDAYRRANGQGVFREAEADFVKGIVETEPTKFFNSLRVDPKYKALEDSNASTLNNLKRGYGLPESHSHTSEPQYKMSGGVKYMRGPNGEAIAVR